MRAVCYLAIPVLLAGVAAGEWGGNHSNHSHHSWEPQPPEDWICYSTARTADLKGGHISDSKCGSSSSSDVWIGWVGVIIAVLFFGSNFVPVKKFDTGDGLFFQWILCIGIWLVGLVTNMARYQPPFFIPSMLGGLLWTTGNLVVVPIIKMIGLTMGLTVWGVTNMLSGWFTGVVILQQKTSCPPLNYSGVAVVVVSVVILAFVKSQGKEVKGGDRRGGVSETTALLSDQTDSLEGSLRDKVLQRENSTPSIQGSADDKLTFSPPSSRNGGLGGGRASPEEVDVDFSWVDRLGVWPKRILGFSLSLFCGILFGFQFLPIEYLKLCSDSTHSCSDLDYLFGHFCGIFLASTIYYAIYCMVTRNRPRVYPRVILPGLISGIMWGIAMVGWFLANQRLSLDVSFPIITAGPGFVSSAWGIFVFREIKGWRNIILYFVAFSISLSGQVMDGLSRNTVHCHT